MTAYAIAHRGQSASCPENTMAAFEAALPHVGVIELDVRATSDAVLVCAHDPSLERCFGDARRIGQLTWSELHEAAPEVPRLADVLAALGQRVGWFLDVKVARPRAIDALIDVVTTAGLTFDSADEVRAGIPPRPGTAVFESPEPRLLQAFHSRTGAGCVELVRGVASAAELALTAGFISTYAQGVVLPDRLARRPMVRLLRALRLGVYVYTVNDQRRFDELAAAGASAVFVDAVDSVGPAYSTTGRE